MRVVRRFSLAFAVASIALLVVAAPSLASGGGGSGTNPFPGCHGKNSVPCRPDPQPTHGKDCMNHGKGGVNDDHCAATSTTVTTAPPATTTTAAHSTTTTTTKSTTTTAAPSATSTTEVPSKVTPIVPTVTDAPLVAPSPLSAAPATNPSTDLPTDLAVTGAGTEALAILGFGLGITGLLLGALGAFLRTKEEGR